MEISKPEPMLCPICKEETDWEWDGEEWNLEGEWWYIQGIYPYLDSYTCYKKALKDWKPEDIIIEAV